MAKKNVTYRVFIIKNEELTHDATDNIRAISQPK